MSVLFIVDDECGNGHVMRCGAIRDDLAAMGVASEVWTGEAEEILRAQVIVVDDYGLGWPLIAQEWGDIGIIVIDDFAPGRRTWPAGTVVIAPVGEYAIVRQAIRRLKGTPKNISHLRVERGSIEAMSGEPLGLFGGFACCLATGRRVSCPASLVAIEAAYLDCELELRVDVPNQQRTYDWLMSGGRPDGLGSVRIAKIIKDMVEP